MIDADVLSSRWKELRSKVKQQWGALTEDDLTTIGGNTDVLVDLLQERYGYPHLLAQEEVDRFFRGLGVSMR